MGQIFLRAFGQSKTFSGAFGASQFRPKNFFGASNNSGSPAGGGGPPHSATHPPPLGPPCPPPPPSQPPPFKQNSAPFPRIQDRVCMLHLEIEDQGEGMDAAMLQNAMKPFQRTPERLNGAAHQGMGLGLPIARYWTESMGGSISLASPGLGQGVTVTIVLRLETVVSADALDNLLPSMDGVRFRVCCACCVGDMRCCLMDALAAPVRAALCYNEHLPPASVWFECKFLANRFMSCPEALPGWFFLFFSGKNVGLQPPSVTLPQPSVPPQPSLDTLQPPLVARPIVCLNTELASARMSLFNVHQKTS